LDGGDEVTGDLKHECAAIAAEVVKNSGSAPQLTFPHIYLGVQRIVGEIYAARKNRHIALLPDGADPLDEIVRLRADLSTALGLLAAWCVAIERNGSGWDDWDEHYKDAAYRPGPLRKQLDAAIAAEKASFEPGVTK
jgi:hypothetical protein